MTLTAHAAPPRCQYDAVPLSARGLVAGYPRHPAVLDGVDVDFPGGRFTVIIGPNGCGKSTLLLALARLIGHEGLVNVLGRDLRGYRPKELARVLSFLPQSPLAPDGITTRRLVLRGREPHRSLFSPLSAPDTAAADAALHRMQLGDLEHSPVAELSGGQRQRAWIAMILAQDTRLMLLDEPTSYLDLAHQVEILAACSALAAEGRTVIAVLHDISLAARYADHLVVMRDGAIHAEGAPHEVLTSTLIAEVFGMPSRIINDPDTGSPVVLPRVCQGQETR